MKRYRLIIALVAFALSLSAASYRDGMELGLNSYDDIKNLMGPTQVRDEEFDTDPTMTELPMPEIPSDSENDAPTPGIYNADNEDEWLGADSESGPPADDDSDDEFSNSSPVVLVAPARYPHSPTRTATGHTLRDRVRAVDVNLRRATDPQEIGSIEQGLRGLSREAETVGDQRALNDIASIRAGIRRFNQRLRDIDTPRPHR